MPVPVIKHRKALARSGVLPAVRTPVDAGHAGSSLGVRYGSFLEAARLVHGGLPFSAVGNLQRASGFTLARIKEIARISEGAFARRKQIGRLSQDVSERLLRVSRLFERAVSLFNGEQEAARQWLETPLPVLDGQRPLDMAQTEPGAREVEDLIGRIEHGVVS